MNIEAGFFFKIFDQSREVFKYKVLTYGGVYNILVQINNAAYGMCFFIVDKVIVKRKIVKKMIG